MIEKTDKGMKFAHTPLKCKEEPAIDETQLDMNRRIMGWKKPKKHSLLLGE